MARIYVEMKIMGGSAKAMEMMNAQYGEGCEFTKKQFEALCKHSGASCLDTLRDHGFVEISRREKITVQLKKPICKGDGVFDQNDQRIMSIKDWYRLPQFAKNAIIAMNGGVEPTEGEEWVDTVETERYWYKFNPAKINAYACKVRPHIEWSVRRKLTKALTEVARCEATLSLFN